MHRVERIIAGIVVALFLLDVALIFVRGCNIDWVGYTQMISVGLGMVAVGIVYRSSGRSEKIGLAAISAGTFIIFTIVGSTFNHLLLPVGDRRIDAALIMIDGHFGYSWPALVSFVASLPSAVGYLLRVVYLSSLTQLIAVIVMLAFSGRSEALRLYLLTGVASALLTIAIWSIFPSSGPSAYFDIPDDIVAKLGMVVGPNYGAELNRLALEGPVRISPRDTLGLIAFPSFHVVMACMAVWFTVSFRLLFPVFLAANLLMIPAILVHGGHHLIDIFGGFAVFAAGLFVARRIISARSEMPNPSLAGVHP